jgi:hypothetical protein
MAELHIMLNNVTYYCHFLIDMKRLENTIKQILQLLRKEVRGENMDLERKDLVDEVRVRRINYENIIASSLSIPKIDFTMSLKAQVATLEQILNNPNKAQALRMIARIYYAGELNEGTLGQPNSSINEQN